MKASISISMNNKQFIKKSLKDELTEKISIRKIIFSFFTL